MFEHEIKNVYPIYISKISFEKYIELLRIKNGGNSDYVFIKDFNRFKYIETKHKDKKHFCMNWLLSFSSLDVLENH